MLIKDYYSKKIPKFTSKKHKYKWEGMQKPTSRSGWNDSKNVSKPLINMKPSQQDYANAIKAYTDFHNAGKQSEPHDFVKKYIGKSPDEYRELKKKSIEGCKNKEVKNAYYNIISKEKDMTPVIENIATSLGGHLYKKDFRLKEGDSYARKAETFMNNSEHPISAKEAIKQIDDGLRYTVSNSPKKLVETFKKTVEALKEKGYKIDRIVNYWDDNQTPVNVLSAYVIPPKSDIQVEVQFHTPESNRQIENTHSFYEVMRYALKERKLTPQLADSISKIFYNEAYNCEIPDGIEKIKSTGLPSATMTFKNKH